jgi:hypothetical protein
MGERIEEERKDGREEETAKELNRRGKRRCEETL